MSCGQIEILMLLGNFFYYLINNKEGKIKKEKYLRPFISYLIYNFDELFFRKRRINEKLWQRI